MNGTLSTLCDQEIIHTPNAIQPHGVLLVTEPDGRVSHVSANAETMLHVPPATLLGRSVFSVMAPSARAALREALEAAPVRPDEPMRSILTDGNLTDVSIHAPVPTQRMIELEPRNTDWDVLGSFRQIRGAVSHLRHSRDLQALCDEAARAVRALTGFDRVIVYRFDSQWNGRAVAENRRDGIASYLGLNFPASDIPAQARALYVLNPLRVIVDARYAPAPMLAAAPHREVPLDMSFCGLRSVSPHHLEYLANMGVRASMSISLFHQDRLWGLITCGHEAGPRYVPFEVRAACTVVGEIMSTLIESKETYEDSDYHLTLKSVQNRLLQFMAQDGDIVSGLTNHQPNMLQVTMAGGAAVLLNGETHLCGVTPTPEQVRDLVHWLMLQPTQAVWVTHTLPALYPPAARFKDSACGLLAVPMSRSQSNWLLWFRPEVVQTVSWGGDPGPASDPEAGMPLRPRTSFELWKQTVHLQSIRWRDVEQQAAQELIRSISDILMQSSEELSQLNRELERSNVELDAFAYAASHDLKEPLRGIHNYTLLAMRELGESKLTGEAGERLRTVIRLTERMEDLINSLLHYAHVGRMELHLCAVNLYDVVTASAEMLRPRLEETGTVLRVSPLPYVRGDEVLLGEVFSNLLANAIKYNDKAQRWIEVGMEQGETGQAFYVRDNGIGIREQNWQTVFKIFRRLHSRDKFGGGTGTGLTITKRIIERHGGKIWIQSCGGEGTTFYFTLGDSPGYVH